MKASGVPAASAPRVSALLFTPALTKEFAVLMPVIGSVTGIAKVGVVTRVAALVGQPVPAITRLPPTCEKYSRAPAEMAPKPGAEKMGAAMLVTTTDPGITLVPARQ